jgi:hypothetical protein
MVGTSTFLGFNTSIVYLNMQPKMAFPPFLSVLKIYLKIEIKKEGFSSHACRVSLSRPRSASLNAVASDSRGPVPRRVKS